MEQYIPIIGILGGVGAGKSTVAGELSQMGCALIDADGINHEVLARPEIIKQIVELWGEGILAPGGEIDRQALGEIVFADSRKLKQLTDLTHPEVLALQQSLIERYRQKAGVKAVILDVPLLMEVGVHDNCDYLIFVDCPESIRRARLCGNRGWNEEKIKKIENFQIMLDKKAQIADYIAHNNSDIPDLRIQLRKILDSIFKVRD